MNFQQSKSPLGTTKAWYSMPEFLLEIGDAYNRKVYDFIRK